VTETFKNHSTFSTISGPVAQPGASGSPLSERAIRALVLYDYVLNKTRLGEPEVWGSKARDKNKSLTESPRGPTLFSQNFKNRMKLSL